MSNTRTTSLFQLLLFVVCAFFLIPAQAQSLDNLGDDFIVAFNPNTLGGVHNIEVQLTGDTATMVTVEYPVNAPTFSTTVAVTPGTVTLVALPTQTANAWLPNAVGNNAVRAFSDDSTEFAMYLVNRKGFTSDAALGLPVETFNTEYLVATYNAAAVGGQFTVVAAFDNTTVTITPTKALIGRAAGVPFNVTLNRGEGYHNRTTSAVGAAGDLTGSIISADRPVGLSNGNGCTNVPTGTFACDHIFEVAQPLQTWGSSIPVANLPLRTGGSIYKILASEDDTTVSQNGAVIGTINAGQFIETSPLTGNHLFEGDKPIYVTQYMTGQGFPGNTTGDPAMGNMIPSAQFQSSYTFATPPGDQFADNFVTIIADNADVGAGTILLDGAPVPAGNFTPVPGTTLSAAVEAIAGGTHTTSSTAAPHGITVEGYDDFDSYIYPGGALFQFINPPETDAPICVANVNPGPPPSASGSVTDNLPDDSGVFFVTLVPGATNLALTVDPFTPGDGAATFSVDLVDPNSSGNGTVQGTDGAGNTCTVDINLSVETVQRCDIDGNDQIDINDIRAITARRNQPATGPDDPADNDGDGVITVNDARQCVLQCTNSRCAP
ncbi:MAG: IgGFc-binding protein [Woeseiaceae bacterium]|nr:IgGFc-binding protein [Woeseiaceae bacterium]